MFLSYINLGCLSKSLPEFLFSSFTAGSWDFLGTYYSHCQDRYDGEASQVGDAE
jgi:hypothetical protein